MDSTFEQQIRERAYLLWLRESGGRGRVDHHWFQAVRDTLAGVGSQTARTTGSTSSLNAPYAGAERAWSRTRVAERMWQSERA
jgi:hypothetical protein